MGGRGGPTRQVAGGARGGGGLRRLLAGAPGGGGSSDGLPRPAGPAPSSQAWVRAQPVELKRGRSCRGGVGGGVDATPHRRPACGGCARSRPGSRRVFFRCCTVQPACPVCSPAPPVPQVPWPVDGEARCCPGQAGACVPEPRSLPELVALLAF